MKKKYKIMGITILLVIYIVLLFVGAVIKVPSELTSVKGSDKVFHFIEYFILAVVLFKFLEMCELKKITKKVNIYILGIIIGIVFIVLSEVVQLFVPGRTFSYYDMLADAIGFALGMGVFRWMFFRR